MTEGSRAEQSATAAVVRPRRRFSIVWLVPLVALLIGVWLGFKAISEKGPTITITFATADGLEAGKTKIKFKDDGELKQIKDKQTFNLNRLRYGVSAKVGFGNFALFGYYNLSPLFKEGEGFHNMGRPIDFNTFTVGISLASF